MRAPDRNRNQAHRGSTSGFRFALSILGTAVLLAQLAAAKPKVAWNSGTHCGISVAEMKSAIDRTLGGLRYVTDSEKAFVHVQHERMSCEEYSRLFEKSEFFRDERQRKAVMEWHWRVYHGDSKEIRNNEIRRLEATLTSSR